MCLLAAHLLQCRSSLCLHPRSGLLLLCFDIASLQLRQFFEQASSICSIFPLCMESKVLQKLTNNIVACRVFRRTPTRIRRIVKICDVDQFLRKLFWFFQSIFLILSSMRLRSRALCILADMEVRVIPRQFLALLPFLRFFSFLFHLSSSFFLFLSLFTFLFKIFLYE